MPSGMMSSGEIRCFGSVQQVRDDINRGADVNAKDQDGTTVLMMAVQWCRDLDVIDALLRLEQTLTQRTHAI